MDQALPNFTCEQTTQRYIPIDPGPHVPVVRRSDGGIHDTISATVTYENGSNEYSDMKIASHPVQGSWFDLTGPIVIGDFGSGLRSIFREENAAAFSFRESSDGPQGRDYVFDFRIPAGKNHTFTYYENGAETRPDVSGALFVDTNTGEVREMSLLASPVNSRLSADYVRFDTKFGRVQFGEAGEFLLPTQSESVVCTRRGLCTRNVTRWTNCRRLAAKSRIILGTN